VFIACKPDTTCRLPTEVLVQIPISHATIDTLIVQGCDNDLVLYNANSSVTSILVPLRQDVNTTQYTLFFNGKHDTLTIFHQNDTHFISLACGCAVYHIIDSICVTARIDTAKIINSAVETTLQDNIKIHLQP
jgi:hypothetical protein